MSSNFDDVGAFHARFGLPVSCGLFKPGFPTDEGILKFRIGFMAEELDEFVRAWSEDDLAGAADALVDLAYVVFGTAHFMGLPWQRLWDEVHRANMQKERAISATQSKRGSVFDVVKPAGWQPPDLARILYPGRSTSNGKATGGADGVREDAQPKSSDEGSKSG